MAEVIYEDLEIDYSMYLKSPMTFAKNVHEKAEELRAILNTNDSVSSYLAGMEKMPQSEIDQYVKAAKAKLDEFWYWVSDNIPTQALEAVAKECRNLGGMVEYIGRDRAFLALSETVGSTDKSVVHAQYCELRDKFHDFLKAAVALKLIDKDEAEKLRLRAMSGNYGSTEGLIHYTFRFGDEEDTYRNHRAVGKRLGLSPEAKLMDVLEWIEANPDCNVTVSRIRN
jgi:hypothetical protein